MPISLAPRQPKLLSVDQRCPSAEMSVTNSKAKTAVHFCEVVSIRSTTHINDMTDEEVANAWFSRREMTAIKKLMAGDVKCITAGRPESADSTFRGLEYRTREGSDKRRANKLESIHAVLDEQDLQHMRGMHDPEGLRRVYLNHSERCQEAAQTMGQADEAEMKRIVMDEVAATTENEAIRSWKKPAFLRLFGNKKELTEELQQLQIRV